VRRDRYDKKELYARIGVKEYRIGDPANKSLEILTLRDKSYVLNASAGENDEVESSALPGQWFELAAILYDSEVRTALEGVDTCHGRL